MKGQLLYDLTRGICVINFIEKEVESWLLLGKEEIGSFEGSEVSVLQDETFYRSIVLQSENTQYY